ncbi:DUF6417 family protein [Streptomyces sp. NPDC058964]|uniref:DUF6417 family protein n=1 Tax=Streptomyces sp. NPDC058964 TaxID=3346681 RepID=UPI0036C914C2
MDDYEHIDLDEIEFAPVAETGERLALLSLEESQDLLRLLAAAAEVGTLSAQAHRIAKEITARVPSEN